MSPTTYSRTAIAFHWVIALLIVGNLIGGKVMSEMDPAPLKYEIFQLHKSFGIIILILSVLRLLWRFTHRAPELPSGMKPYERFAAKAAHVGFYVLMIGIPMAGWILVSSATPQIATKIFKVVPWPDFPGIPRSEGFSDVMGEVHELLAYAIFLLLLLHIGAALKHHFVDRDNVLTRMLPFLKTKG